MTTPASHAIDVTGLRPQRARDLVRYYADATGDFAPWSAVGNMHFGFYRPGLDISDREALLAQMNEEVAHRLGIAGADGARIIDLGCGTGATLRQLLVSRPGWRATGVTLVPEQVELARSAAREARLNSRTTFLCEDYRQLSFPSRRFDGALAIESSCYGQGYAKVDFLREAARMLKPGARLVVADVFFKDRRPLPALLRQLNERVCDGWELETFARLPDFRRALQRDFDPADVEDVSIQVLPSVLHVPVVSTRFLWDCAAGRAPLTPARCRHAAAPLCAALMGLARTRLGYYLLSATRK